jgi:hypothetical protein
MIDAAFGSGRGSIGSEKALAQGCGGCNSGGTGDSSDGGTAGNERFHKLGIWFSTNTAQRARRVKPQLQR